MQTHLYQNAAVEKWQDKVNKLLERWDGLTTRLTNSKISQQDLTDLSILWSESERYLALHCVQFDLSGDQVPNYSGYVTFYDAQRLEQFVVHRGSEKDEQDTEFLEKHCHTLTICF